MLYLHFYCRSMDNAVIDKTITRVFLGGGQRPKVFQTSYTLLLLG